MDTLPLLGGIAVVVVAVAWFRVNLATAKRRNAAGQCGRCALPMTDRPREIEMDGTETALVCHSCQASIRRNYRTARIAVLLTLTAIVLLVVWGLP